MIELSDEDEYDAVFRTKFDLSNSKWHMKSPTTWIENMEIGYYSHGKSYPLLATVRNSPNMNKVVIITSCSLISHQWTRYCQKMLMTYKVLEEQSSEQSDDNSPFCSLEQSDDNPPFCPYDINSEEDCQVLIIDLLYYLSDNFDRGYFNKFKRCIVDVQGINLRTQNLFENQLNFLVETMAGDSFEIIYNLTKTPLPEPKFFECNSMNILKYEVLVMPMVRIYDDDTIKIYNKTLSIRYNQLCSILLVKRNESSSEENLRNQFKLPTFLTLYNSPETYLRDKLNITQEDPLYKNKMRVHVEFVFQILKRFK